MNTDNFSYLVKQNAIIWLVLISAVLSKSVLSSDLEISQSPLAVKDTAAPNVMLAMSRDHQLFVKAYTDYSDLDGDGILEPTEITYNDSVDYYGYFDSKKCYIYASSLFEPSGSATGHQCSSKWSGNFLNWATMTRMDIIRKVLYGGYRSTDGVYGGGTILERTLIPYDAHAFVKVFSPGSTTEMQKYTPYAQTVISICNLTQYSGTAPGLSGDINTTTYPPLMRVARGSVAGGIGWPGWAPSATNQCQWGSGTLPGTGDNLVSAGTENGLNVRVKVCKAGLEETNCKSYTNKSTGNITKKPTGLLQKYWESDKPIRFGLMTGSWGNNQSGGVLRAIAQAGSNEINSIDGTFKSPSTPDKGGIIATLNRFRISGYQFTSKIYDNEKDWGNPLSEIYLETLRYFADKGSALFEPTPDDKDSVPSVVPPLSAAYELEKKNWNKPIGELNWCAKCSIIAISAGTNSFDTDQLAGNGLDESGADIDADTETNKVGTEEGISGNYLIGSSTRGIGTGSDNNQQCTGKTVSSLSDAQGICPEAPSLKGGYHIAGLAYYARTHDLFTTESTNPYKPDEVYFAGVQSINTYSVALSESLPRFEIPVGGGTVTFLPACEANSNASAISSSSDWKPCSMTDLKVENLHHDSSGKLDSGSFTVVWEDATSGSDYDMDGIEHLAFCVGSACSPHISSGKIKITTSVVQTDSPKAMQFGYTIYGSDDNGIKLPVLRPGSSTGPLPGATNTEYSKGVASAKLLENPLWYAAKYGGFDTIDTTESETPALQSWDEDANGIPDAFFKATNPALLESALDEVLNKVASKLASSSSVAANSTRLDTSAAFYQAKFSPAGWTGQLLAYKINTTDGSLETTAWDAGEIVTTQGFSGRSIFSYNDSTYTGVDFVYGNLSIAQKLLLTEDQLNYIKGDQSKEKPGGTLRKRTGSNRLMGDIVNSDPEFINTISQGYDSLPGNEGSDYLEYITSPAFIGRAPMLAVGANDGMIHVFNASLGTADSGKEIFAYVPSTIIGKLPALTLPTYIVDGNHKYLVDGSPSAGDVYFDADGDVDKEWRTALVGTTGAGGKGLFALDITFLNPNDYNVDEPFSASRVLWEINDHAAPQATDLTDDNTVSPKRYGFANYLGLTMGQVSIVRMADGNFAAVLGNGYNSVSQTAVLYIVNIKNGHLIRSITTGVGDTTQVNGLSTPLTVDANGDHIIDVIYAGDYLGNMWKFDVSDHDPANWKVAFTASGLPAPLFTTKSSEYRTPDPAGDCSISICTPEIPQPITAKPEFGQHPNGGIMLYFGTGKYFLTGDNEPHIESDPVETFYGIWDDCVNYAGGTGSCSNVPIGNKEDVLVSQTIVHEDVNNRVTSSNAVDYSTKKGWYMDLYKGSDYLTGERVISQALIRNRRIIFSTIYPDTGLCVSGGSSWLMMLDALTGKRLDVSAFVSNGGVLGDEKVPISVAGTPVSGVKSKAMIDTPSVIKTDNETAKLVSPDSSGEKFIAEISVPPGGRQSWQQIR